MTNRWDTLAPNTKKVAKLLAERMPHLKFAIWDLSEFMHTFHNVRRNMIFIECDKVAHEEAMRIFAADKELSNNLVYAGERKPISVNEEWAEARSKEIRDVIAFIGRKEFSGKEIEEIEGNIYLPGLERRLVDLLAYSIRGWLPINISEAVDALAWHLKANTALKITLLQRYATRRYLGWFVDMLIFKLEEKNLLSKPGIDPRYIEVGKRYWAASRVVEHL